MAYNIKYFGQFDSFKDEDSMKFEVQIFQKDYEGTKTEILLSGVPAVHDWQDDERNKPIKGSTLKVGIINNGVVNLESFYSNYDDEFKVNLCQRLNASRSGNIAPYYDGSSLTGLTFYHSSFDNLNLSIGQTFEVTDQLYLSGTYTVANIIKYEFNDVIITVETLPVFYEASGYLNFLDYNVLFTGYIVQDECAELLTFFNHEITITATDMLGTLKDITLDEANNLYGRATNIDAITFNALDTVYLYTTDSRISVLKAGDRIIFSGSAYDGEKKVLSLTYDVIFGYKLLIDNRGWPSFSSIDCNVTYFEPIDLSSWWPLSTFFRICLQATKLQLDTNVISQFFDVNGDTSKFIESTGVYGTTFLNSGTYMSCYDILESILSRFRATLYQSKGQWWIIRVNELFNNYTSGFPAYISLTGYKYNVDFDYIAPVNISDYSKNININQMENGVIKSIERPIGYVKDTFQYKQPDSLLKNANLQELGSLLNTYTTGSGESLQYIYEYELPYWQYYTGNTVNANKFIRIVKDLDNVEKERYIVLAGDDVQPYPYAALQSNDIYVSTGDRVSFTVEFKTKVGITANVLWGENQYYIMGTVLVKNDTDTYYLNKDNGWEAVVNYDNDPQVVFNYPDGTSEWHTYSINTNSIPINGVLNIFLFTPKYGDLPPYEEIYFKNLDFKTENYLSGLGNVIGHSHLYKNNISLNNIIENDIIIDTSSSINISGTLLLDNITDLVRNKSQYWAYTIPGGGFTGYGTLGSRITAEDLMMRYKARYKYEGNLLNVFNPFPGDYIIGPETIFSFEDQGLNIFFIFGKLSIDYKNGNADCSMIFIVDPNDDIINIYDNYLYEFNYLYENN